MHWYTLLAPPVLAVGSQSIFTGTIVTRNLGLALPENDINILWRLGRKKVHDRRSGLTEMSTSVWCVPRVIGEIA